MGRSRPGKAGFKRAIQGGNDLWILGEAKTRVFSAAQRCRLKCHQPPGHDRTKAGLSSGHDHASAAVKQQPVRTLRHVTMRSMVGRDTIVPLDWTDVGESQFVREPVQAFEPSYATG